MQQREDQRRDREDREDQQRRRKDRKDQPGFEWRERWRERWSARERYAVEHCHLSWSASCVSTMATAGTDEQTLLLRARCISADSWGAGLPSFWCVELPQIGERRQFIVREEHALQFGAEFPECAGGHILSMGPTTYKGTDEAKLVEAQPPAGYVRNTQAARPERFVNERVKMTEVGKRDLARGVRKNQIVWGRRYRCGGINTYRCVSDTTLNTSPCASAQTIGRGLTAGTTVVATDTKVLNDKRWIQIGRAWACTTDIVTGAVKLRDAGCRRECGGVSICTPTCTNEKKSRHGCSFRIHYERTLSLIHQGLVRITVIGQHTPDLASWDPLPGEHRAISTATRQAILKQAADKRTAKTIQMELNRDARETGSLTDGRGAVVDHSVVPNKRKIQQVIKDRAKAGRDGMPPWEVVDVIARSVNSLFVYAHIPWH